MSQVEGILPHTYRNASDDPAAYDADQCNRQAVTVKFAWDNLCDYSLWYWNPNAMDDPWIMIAGLDANFDYSIFYIEYGRAGVITGAPDTRIFAQRCDLKTLGFPEGKPGGFHVPA